MSTYLITLKKTPSKQKSKTLKNLVYRLYTIWYVIATITQEQTERATHWGIDHNAQRHQNPTKQKRLMKVLNYNNKLKKTGIELSNIFPSNLAHCLQQHE